MPFSAGTPALWTSWPGRKGDGAASSTARRFRCSRDGSREQPGIIQRFRSGAGDTGCYILVLSFAHLLCVVFTSTTGFRLRNCEVARDQPRLDPGVRLRVPSFVRSSGGQESRDPPDAEGPRRAYSCGACAHSAEPMPPSPRCMLLTKRLLHRALPSTLPFFMCAVANRR